MSLNPVQNQPTTLAGAGNSTGDTTLILTNLLAIDGVTHLTIANFGSKGYATVEPGNGIQEEQISFTGITNNANGTDTLTGVSTVLFISPYTETSGLAKVHPGGASLVISNTAGFYNNFAVLSDAETISGLWTFTTVPVSATDPTGSTQVANKHYVDNTAFAGAPNASTSTKGIVQEAIQSQVDGKTVTGSTGADLYLNPGTQRSTLLSDYVDSDTGIANAYAIAVSPVISAYVKGQVFIFKAAHASTTASTLAVCGLTAVTIKKYLDVDIAADDIEVGQVVVVVYDGTNMQMMSLVGDDPAGIYQTLGNLSTTSSLGTSDTLYPSQKAVKTYVDNQTPLWKTGNTTHDMTSTTTTTIAHGLGATPIMVRLTVMYAKASGSGGTIAVTSYGTYDGATQNAVWIGFDTNGTLGASGIDTTHIVKFQLSASGDNGGFLLGSASVDGTNITITWAKTGGVSASTGDIIWEAMIA